MLRIAKLRKKSHFALLFCSSAIRFLVPAHSHTKTQASAREEAKGPQMRFFLFSSSTGLKSASFTRLGASVRSESVIHMYLSVWGSIVEIRILSNNPQMLKIDARDTIADSFSFFILVASKSVGHRPRYLIRTAEQNNNDSELDLFVSPLTSIFHNYITVSHWSCTDPFQNQRPH